MSIYIVDTAQNYHLGKLLKGRMVDDLFTVVFSEVQTKQ